MVRQLRYLTPLVAALAVGHWATAVSFADGLEAEASWSIVSPQQVAENVLDWVRQQKADDPVRRKAEALWTAESVADGRYDLLERAVATMAVVVAQGLARPSLDISTAPIALASSAASSALPNAR